MAATLNEVLSRLENARKSGSGYIARCPAHDDKNASLSVAEGEAGRIMFKCHAGCTAEAVVSALGFTMRDMMGETARQSSAGKRIKATYDYTDENGVLLFQKVRYEPKGFTIRRPDERGGWVYDRKGVKLVPYSLKALLSSDYALLVEGEKDVETLHKMNLTATCAPDGAGNGKFRPELVPWFKDKRVYIVPDNDKPGRDFSHEQAAKLAPVAKVVKVLDLTQIWPELPEHGDITDIVQQIGAEQTKQALREIVKVATKYRPLRVQDGRDWVDNPPQVLKPLGWNELLPLVPSPR